MLIKSQKIQENNLVVQYIGNRSYQSEQAVLETEVIIAYFFANLSQFYQYPQHH